MQIKYFSLAPIRAAFGAVILAAMPFSQISAQESAAQRPLSVIDWINQITPPKPVVLRPNEPDVAKEAHVPQVQVLPLQNPAPKIIGLIPSSVSGFPDDLWTGASGSVLARHIRKMPDLTLPAAQSLYFTLLLAESDPPLRDSRIFALARVDALLKAGALEPALSLIEQIGPQRDPETSRRYIEASLLNETEASACALINATQKLAPDYAYRIFCAARAGDWETAVLLLGTARALEAITPLQSAALERFLDPDLFEDSPTLERPQEADALLFRIYEALGQPLPTRSWPVLFANADLRDVSGWKTRIEAAERLAQTSALPANHLLGIYSQRQPAASGGIWERVSAVQRFETALRSGSINAIAKTLPKAWQEMRAAQLEVVFATLFAEQLLPLPLPQNLQGVAYDVVQSSRAYEQAAGAFPFAAQQQAFRTGLAQGVIESALANTALEQAIAAAFDSDSASDSASGQADVTLVKTAREQGLGLTLLDALSALQNGAQGDLKQLNSALSTLRMLGLEDDARRAALQILIRQ